MASANNMKWVSLVCLTFQNALLSLSMRYSRVRSDTLFYEGTAVLMAEVVKFVTCCFLVFRDEQHSVVRFKDTMYKNLVVNYKDTLKVCVPSFIYLIQNNCLYVAAEHLDTATYQITYQLKILTTAMFAVLILKRSLIKTQWLSLLILIVGVAMVQLSDAKESNVSSATAQNQNKFFGFCVALFACFLSGLAGIYFEKILKGSDVSVWMRNIQLSILAIPLGVMVCATKHGSAISENGFFHGYDAFVAYLVALNATGGLLVAVVVKYADNILKGFACSLAIIITCVVSVFAFGFQLSFQFCTGAALVIASVFLYGYKPPEPRSTKD